MIVRIYRLKWSIVRENSQKSTTVQVSSPIVHYDKLFFIAERTQNGYRTATFLISDEND